MLKKTIRRLGALAMVLAMAVSVFAVNASAVGEQEPTTTPTMTANITKKITKEANVYLPNATFTFTATVANPGQSSDTNYTNPGADALQLSNEGVITSAPSEDATILAKAGDVEVGTVNITVDTTKFSKDGKAMPGTYYYDITETGSYDGMTYVGAARKYVVIIDSKGEVLSQGFVKWNEEKQEYEKDTGDFVNAYNTKNLTITKKVEGTAGDKNKEFSFTVTITNANTSAEEWYRVVKGDSSIVIKNGTYTFTLKNNESITFTGLSENDSYTVTEADYVTNDKYNAPTAKLGGNNLDMNKNTVDSKVVYTASVEKMGKTANDVTVTNKKDFATPGGVIMTIAPYALMLVVAGAFAVVFLSRRNRAE